MYVHVGRVEKIGPMWQANGSQLKRKNLGTWKDMVHILADNSNMKISVKTVPKVLTGNQKVCYKKICSDLLPSLPKKKKKDVIISGKLWIFQCQGHQEKSPSSPCPQSISKVKMKMMLICSKKLFVPNLFLKARLSTGHSIRSSTCERHYSKRLRFWPECWIIQWDVPANSTLQWKEFLAKFLIKTQEQNSVIQNDFRRTSKTPISHGRTVGRRVKIKGETILKGCNILFLLHLCLFLLC